MSPEECLEAFRRITCAYNAYSPPFTFGRKVEAAGMEEVREQWRSAHDRSSLNGSVSLYLHVPFCRSRRCAFCMYGSSADCSPARLDRYCARVGAELDGRKEDVPPTVQNLYVGGGTPSVYSPRGLYELLRPFSSFSYAPDGERTCEMSRPLIAVATLALAALAAGASAFCEQEWARCRVELLNRGSFEQTIGRMRKGRVLVCCRTPAMAEIVRRSQGVEAAFADNRVVLETFGMLQEVMVNADLSEMSDALMKRFERKSQGRNVKLG